MTRIPSLPFPPYPGVRASLPTPRLALELWFFRPDVVHAVGPACLGVWGIGCARALGIPIVASYPTDLPRYLPLHGLGLGSRAIWPLIRWVHGQALVNLCPSSFTRDELRENGVPNVDLWRGGVDTDVFHPSRRSLEMRGRLAGGRLDAPPLLYVGRLSAEKKIEQLAPLLDAIPETRLALVGDGPARPELERLFAGRPVTFAGFLRGEELASAFASADVFLMPSTTETLGFVVLEAMASGCAVVAAAAGGIPDLVRDGENGLLYDPTDPRGLIDGVRGLLADRGRRAFQAAQGRKTAEGCTWSNETRRLEGFYREAIELQRQRASAPRLSHSRARGR